MLRIKIHHTIHILTLWLTLAAGSAAVFLPSAQAQKPSVVKDQNFVLVTTTAQDSLASLAKRYLKDPNKGWWIANYNQINAVTPGQQLIIPLIPLSIGGLRADGYQTVPVLNYTEIAAQPTKPDTVSSRDFDRQMNYLKENDFIAISLDQFSAFLNLQDQLPSNAVMITFNTAERWVYDTAFPIIQRHGMRAALFVPTEQIGQPGKLAWFQLSRMAAGGIDIGALGLKINAFNGKKLSLTIAAMDKYILKSKKAIERHLNRPCRDFSAPLSEINDLTTAVLKKHGFRSCYTQRPGPNPFFINNFGINRSVISGRYNLHQFGQNLLTFHKAQQP